MIILEGGNVPIADLRDGARGQQVSQSVSRLQRARIGPGHNDLEESEVSKISGSPCRTREILHKFQEPPARSRSPDAPREPCSHCSSPLLVGAAYQAVPPSCLRPSRHLPAESSWTCGNMKSFRSPGACAIDTWVTRHHPGFDSHSTVLVMAL